MINFTDAKGYASVVVPDAGSGNITIKEMMSEVNYTRNADEMKNSGLVVGVDAWNTQVFKY